MLGAPGTSFLDLDDDGVAAFREIFSRFADETGLPGERILADLEKGKPVHETLGITETVIEGIYALAYQHLGAGHIEKAERLFGILTLFVPTAPMYWLGLSLARRLSGDRSAAMQALDMVERIAPEWPVLHFHRMELYIEARDMEGARRELAAFKVQPNDQGVSPYMIKQVERYALALADRAR